MESSGGPLKENIQHSSDDTLKQIYSFIAILKFDIVHAGELGIEFIIPYHSKEEKQLIMSFLDGHLVYTQRQAKTIIVLGNPGEREWFEADDNMDTSFITMKKSLAIGIQLVKSTMTLATVSLNENGNGFVYEEIETCNIQLATKTEQGGYEY